MENFEIKDHEQSQKVRRVQDILWQSLYGKEEMKARQY